jgi:hypothetical protein
MRRLATAVSAFALIVTTSASPAFAVIDPTFGGTYPDLDAECDLLLNPGENSGFTTFALVHPSDSGTSVLVTTETVDTGVISTVGVGTPTTTGTAWLGAHVNGQSPNIWATGGLTVTYSAKKVTYSTQTTTTTTVTAKCHVHKPTEGTTQDDDPLHPGYKIAPPGHNNDYVDSVTTSVTTGTREEIIEGPWVDPDATTFQKNILICISPGTSTGPKGGTWRTSHGYVNGSLGAGSTCSTTWYYQLQAINPVPTESLPPA